MFSLRGDAHKIYLQLKNAEATDQSFQQIKAMQEVRNIQKFYEGIDTETLKIIYYRMLKEKNGSGIILIFVTAIPWFLFLFSSKLEGFLFEEGSLHWLGFSLIYISVLFGSVILQFREKAWTSFHVEIIKDILEERKDE
ncbi:hypothetical protein [Fredinandcohnia sp. 179-A 10B2 NHS]|uniref:hypothetical protein n=1 Tax=Fredinandcohnia sp. 179-A 10B2 NHS TaxID=3235176 RepID=UPI00399F484A